MSSKLKLKIFKKKIIFSILGVIICVYPPLLNWISFGTEGILNYFANDTFYYLTIAKNQEWHPLFSFDGENPTNGFHPLYQIFLKFLFNSEFFFNDTDKRILFVYFTSIFLTAISVFLIIYRLIDLGFSSLLSIISIVPGFFFIIFTNPLGQYGSLWSFINGMESPFSIFFFSLLFFFTLKKNFFLNNFNNKITFLTILLSLMIFSRLDDFFIIFSVIFLFFFYRKNNSLYFNFIQFITITFILIIIYLVINYVYAGTFLPSSGGTKFGVSAYYNLMSFANSFIPLGEILTINNWQVWQKTSWRSLLLFLPFLLSCYYLLYYYLFQKKIANKSLAFFLLLMSQYVILKFLYNFLFVFIWHQGHWYFPISIISSNIIILFFISKYLNFKNLGKFYFTFGRQKTKYLKNFLYAIFTFFSIYLINLYFNNQKLFDISFIRLFSVLIFFIFLIACIIYIKKYKILKINVFPYNTIIILIILLYSNSYIDFINRLDLNSKNKIFYRNHKTINDDLFSLEKKLNQEIKIISYDDGIVGYFLNFKVLSGFGYALDKEAIIAKKNGKLLELAEKRGYNYLTSVNYLKNSKYDERNSIRENLQNSFWLSDYEKQNYDFKIIYNNINSDFNLIHFKKLDNSTKVAR